MEPFRDAHAPSRVSRPRTDVPTEPPLIGPDTNSVFLYRCIKKILRLHTRHVSLSLLAFLN